MEQQHHPLSSVYELIQTLRLTATMHYEVEKSKGTPDEEIAKKLEPIMSRLEQAQQAAARDDFDGVCHAIIQFELDAQAFEDHAQYLLTKAADVRAHAERLRGLLLAHLSAEGKAQHMGLVHSATVIESIGKGKSKQTLVVR